MCIDYCCVYEMDFFMCVDPFFSPVRGSCLAFSAAGHARGPRVLTGETLGPGRASAARALGVQKSLGLANNPGMAFRLAEPRRTMETPQFWFLRFLLCCCFCMESVPRHASSSRALYSVAATVQQRWHVELVSFCDGHGP